MAPPRTLGELRDSGYRPLRVKDEIRHNLLHKIRTGEPFLAGMVGYDETVLPEVIHGLLARHDLLLLGTRGQGKTRLLRQLIDLLDETIPVVAGSDLRDDPLAPVSAWARQRIAEQGEDTPIAWLGREERYVEKLATPDVTMADLFGDVDLMKHIQGRSLAEEGSLHFGLIPRANRGIFCINELPDLAARIQVGLFNLLQERDVQIRGYPVRFPLDLLLVFSANPEDYTSRGRIVSPLKDRIGSVIRTHYPRTRQEGVAVTDASAWTTREGVTVNVPGFMKEIVEEVARRARSSAEVDQQSGVSARLAIAGRELLISSAERRAVALREPAVVPRISDLAALMPGARGKLEVLLPGEEISEDRLIAQFIDEAIRAVFLDQVASEALRPALAWFARGGAITVGDCLEATTITTTARGIPGLWNEAVRLAGEETGDSVLASAVEFLLEGLYQTGRLGKRRQERQASYRAS